MGPQLLEALYHGLVSALEMAVLLALLTLLLRLLTLSQGELLQQLRGHFGGEVEYLWHSPFPQLRFQQRGLGFRFWRSGLLGIGTGTHMSAVRPDSLRVQLLLLPKGKSLVVKKALKEVEIAALAGRYSVFASSPEAARRVLKEAFCRQLLALDADIEAEFSPEEMRLSCARHFETVEENRHFINLMLEFFESAFRI